MNDHIPEHVSRFIRLFREGQYYESHECLEDYWREHREPYYQGLIQLAVARHHAERGNFRGAKTQALKSFHHLSTYFARDEHPGRQHGIEISPLLAYLVEFVQQLERNGSLPPPPPLGAMKPPGHLPSFLHKRYKRES